MSLGRIPIFVDTDSVLPLEDIIDYHDFIVRVDYREIRNIDKIVSDYYRSLSTDDFILKQKKAREVFESHLRVDRFFSHAFTSEFLKKYE